MHWIQWFKGLTIADVPRVGGKDVLKLAKWAMLIGDHYTTTRGVDCPMDIEWAKDGKTGELFIVQARPETVRSMSWPRSRPTSSSPTSSARSTVSRSAPTT